MKKFKNLKIRTKLISSFLLITVIVVVVCVYGVTQIHSVDVNDTYAINNPKQRLTYVLSFEANFNELRRATLYMATYAALSDMTQIETGFTDANTAYNSAKQNLTDFTNSMSVDTVFSASDKSLRFPMLAALNDGIDQYMSAVTDVIISDARNGQFQNCLTVLAKGTDISDSLTDSTESLINLAVKTSQQYNDIATAKADISMKIMIILIVIVAALSVFLALFISSLIVKPLKALVGAAEKVGRGNLDVSIDTGFDDEVGVLAKEIQRVVQTVNYIVADINTLYARYDGGEMSARISTSRYSGSYGEITMNINKMAASFGAMINDIFYVLDSFGNGKFDTYLKTYEGEKHGVNVNMQVLRDIITKITQEFDRVANDCVDGKYNSRADAAQFNGEWRNILLGLNRVMDVIATQPPDDGK